MPTKPDVVIETVRYTPEGQIALVRGYERRGATYSDRVLFTRVELVGLLRSGKKVAFGKRLPLLASTFEILSPVSLSGTRGAEVIGTPDISAERDQLQDVPLF